MDPDTGKIKMEDHPSHWKATLLGEDFWKDAHQYNQLVNDDIEADHSSTLHTRFPFNLGQEEGPRIVKVEEPPKKQRRRFSMSDALGLNKDNKDSNNKDDSGSLKPPRLFHIRRDRSRSRSRSPCPSIASETRGLLRASFNMRRNKEEDVFESVLSAPAPLELGTPSKPLMYFRGGVSWAILTRDMPALGLDLLWPIKTDDEEEQDDSDENEKEEMLPLEDMLPLCEFRRLRVLKITGMMQSYQKYIWQAVWLNTGLEELELGMALEPRIRESYAKSWPMMKGGWEVNPIHYGEPVYFGDMGDGNLNRKFGIGEYFDKTAMEKAKIRAMAMGRTLHRFSIRKLTLNGFVVDADPFLHWFDPKRLRCINFKNHCVDAGFYLCLPMKHVTILCPRESYDKSVYARRMNLFSDLKLVELKGGKKISEIPYRTLLAERAAAAAAADKENMSKNQGSAIDTEDTKDEGKIEQVSSELTGSPKKKDPKRSMNKLRKKNSDTKASGSSSSLRFAVLEGKIKDSAN